MNLGWSAITLASHLSLVMSIAFAFANAIAVRKHWIAQSPVAVFIRLEGPIFGLAAALMVERLYYVFARLLVNSELNLWQAHPAPECLSFLLASAIFRLATAIRKLDGAHGMRVRNVIVWQSAFLLCLFSAVAWGLW